MLLISLTFEQSALTPIEIDLYYDYRGDHNNQKNITAFHAIPTDTARYVKIIVRGNDLNPNTNHIISFYGKDSTLTERKQLSQSTTEKTIMILYNAQFIWDFYFTVKCAKIPCSYKLAVFRYYNRNGGFYVGEHFSYYVMKENRQMSFTIDTSDEIKARSGNYIVAVWIKGNKKVKHEIKKWVHQSNYGYYYINIDDFKKSSHELTVIGQIGDFISIGSIIYQKNALEYVSLSKYVCNGFEISGYLSADEKFSYLHDNKINNLGLPYSLSNNWNKIKYSRNLQYKENLYTEQLSAEEDSFYSFQFLNTTKYDGEGNNKYMPQILGVYYPRLINEGTTIGLIPEKPDDNFSLITYETILISGRVEVSIFECYNYPLCQTDDINDVKSEILSEAYKSYIIDFKSDEYKYISPITQKQKMLMIKCINGSNIDGLENVCKIVSIMKVDRDMNYNNDIYKFIQKNEDNNYLIPKSDKLVYLNIEIISGNIKTNIANITDISKTFYQNENKILYIFSGNENINITITGIEDSIYTIYDYYDSIILNSLLPIGKAHLLDIKDRLIFKPVDNFNASFYKNNIYYLAIKSLDCSLSISTFDNLEKNNFAQYYRPKSIRFLLYNKQ